ncbi:unnamed protein product [Adineta steineri]|uniref:Ricin B lectin domain-containing protein n=1 Tax=Adineta steineri TaxID=433720 RepID=A0A814Z5Y4_9BILA|nr:unnamed protein product [Adineta steineri]CAF1260597.1 unnamed protein product [Adineta steineri]CAF3833496.1 unnamed protein product [Adineta steineri]CAF4085838.1 unnamed protein product [Adineta steineri]
MIRFLNAQTERRLDSNGAGEAYGNRANNDLYQVWEMINTLDNSINLKNFATGLYLDSNGKDEVCTLPRNGSAHQRWRFDGLRIINVATGGALDSNNAGAIYLLEPNGGNCQNWIREYIYE